MHRILILAGLIIGFAHSTASAQDLGQDMASIVAGSYVVYSDGSRTFVQVFRGPSGPYWIVDVVEGADPNGLRVSREFRDSRGQAVRSEFASGMVLSFAPHNCQRTPGPCLFNQTGPDGTIMQGRVTTATQGGYVYELSIFDSRGDPFLAESGNMVLDPMGGFAQGTITRQDGSVTQVRQVQAVYR